MVETSRHKMYTTLPFGLISSMFIYCAVFFISEHFGRAMPYWLWFLGLPSIVVGLLIQYFSKRVFWIRFYQSAISLFTGLIHLVALWLILHEPQRTIIAQALALLLLILFFVFVFGSYYRTMNHYQAELLTMPHGTVGTISIKTGLLNTEVTPTKIERRTQTHNRYTDKIKTLIPLLIGLAFYVMKVYGPEGHFAILILTASMSAIVCAIIAGILAVYVTAIRRWEQQHHLRLYLQR